MKKNKTIILLIILFLLNQIAANLGHPVTPALVESLGIEDYMFGVFFALMATGLTVGGLVFGYLGDRYRKKYMIVIGYLIYGIAQFGFGYAENQYAMIFFRFLAGLGAAATITLSTALVIAHTKEYNRTKILGFVAAAMTLGASIGYYIGGQLGSNQWIINLFGSNQLKYVFLTQSILNMIVGMLAYIFLQDEVVVMTDKKDNFFKSLRSISKLKPTLLIFLFSLMLFTMGKINTEKYLDVYFNDLGYSSGDIGTFVLVTGIVSLSASIFIVPLFNRYKNKLFMIAVMHAMAALILIYVFRSSAFMTSIYSIYMLYIVIRTVYQPLEQSYISNYATDGKYAMIMGVRQSFLSLGMIVGPVVGGLLYQITPRYLFDSSAILFIMSTLCLMIVILMLKKQPELD